MRTAALWLGTAALLLLTALTAALVLQACSLRLPFLSGWIGSCPQSGTPDARPAVDLPERQALQAQIAELELQILAKQCRPAAPARPGLAGCWNVTAPNYTVRDEASRLIAGFSDWRICLGPDGTGTEVMRNIDGSQCEGPITGVQNETGAIRFDETADMTCSNGYSIFRRTLDCATGENGLARCSAYQPRSDHSVDVIMRRAEESP